MCGFGHGLFWVFVDGEGDDGGPVLSEESADAGHFFFAVFEVDAVDDAFSGGEFESGLDDFGLGAVEHEWGLDVWRESVDDVVHVFGSVAADEVDADVEDV